MCMSIFECSFCLFSAVVPINVFLLTIAIEFAAAAAAHHLTTERPDGPAARQRAGWHQTAAMRLCGRPHRPQTEPTRDFTTAAAVADSK